MPGTGSASALVTASAAINGEPSDEDDQGFDSAGPSVRFDCHDNGLMSPDDYLPGLSEFCDAPMFTRSEVVAAQCPVPKEPGVYGWWFRTLPTQIDTSHCLTRDGCALLYTGISPARPPTNGRPPSRQRLRDRIKYHYTGNAEGSTLRKTLGVLLSTDLDIELRRIGSGKRMTFGDGEQALSAWMAANAFVAWIVHPEPWTLESELISDLDVPLNLAGNTHNAFHPTLTAERSAATARARSLPIVANTGRGGR